jgi:hypothetical protein
MGRVSVQGWLEAGLPTEAAAPPERRYEQLSRKG